LFKRGIMNEPEPAGLDGEVRECALRLMSAGLAEDLRSGGDITSRALVPERLRGAARLVARQPGVLAGLAVARCVFLTHAALCPACGLAMLQRRTGDGLRLACANHPACPGARLLDDAAGIVWQPACTDGAALAPGQAVARITGPLRDLLACERLALNFLQRLSGIATLTRRFCDAIAGLPCSIYDTRKTTPGWRALEKSAVRAGGGRNHRMGLDDGVLIKDNHLVAWRLRAGAARLDQAVTAARAAAPAGVPIELEVDSIAQLREALPGRPDIVLLDNMTPDQMRQAVAIRDGARPRFALEASGGVQLGTVRAIAETGVDRISVGALTHSAAALDLALDFEEPAE
jgi:nicotinate-nucleotide pyrophosphorylase (carboxylating)